ncbi:MAG: Putative cytochrome P450 hydroxylase, partial [uncultured Rubrobacteraceae bacterium]
GREDRCQGDRQILPERPTEARRPVPGPRVLQGEQARLLPRGAWPVVRLPARGRLEALLRTQDERGPDEGLRGRGPRGGKGGSERGHSPHSPRRGRVARRVHPRGPDRAAQHRLGQPRSIPLPGPGPLRYHQRTRPHPQLRPRPARLPGGAPGDGGGQDLARDPLPPHAENAPRRDTRDKVVPQRRQPWSRLPPAGLL